MTMDEIEQRLIALPDSYPEFVRGAMCQIEEDGLQDEVSQLLDGDESASDQTISIYLAVRRGLIEIVDE